MKRYNLFNNVFGWVSFLIAAITYLLTIEPTASFWDCGEFILSSYKMEVGHPPGAPFFMLTAKFFSLFASSVTEVAIMVNSMSAILSALTILFLFWTVTHLARKLIYTDTEKEMTLGQIIVIIGSGLVGALAYTFSDTFWFSAVEAEVYAYSSMCTALVFWLILKWENRADEPGSDKWLVLIAYAMGLSIGVHLLNLLCIPAIVLVYYFKKNKEANLLGTTIALAISFFLVVVLMYGIIPGFTKVGGWFELLFVNEFGFSYNIGFLIYIALLLGSIIWGLYETLSQKGDLKRAKVAFVLSMLLSGVIFISSEPFLWLLLAVGLGIFLYFYKGVDLKVLNTTLLCLLVILVGYSSFAIIPIRSIANTPMDQNSPEDVFTLASYLNREQYGDRPLFSGKTYASREKRTKGVLNEPIGYKEQYSKVVKTRSGQSDEYVIATRSPKYEITNEMMFPRMHSNDQRHLMGYQMWGGITNVTRPPTIAENIQFFVTYQLDYMYFRYFMWNFSGRQNDIQGDGSIGKGNWITGIGFVDEFLGRGPQNDLPPDIADNKGHNGYYALPFILGILGVFFQLGQRKEGSQQFLVTFMLFFMTGIAIILYLNQQPFEPRERDYAYAGSFYAYCIWIGLGVAFLWSQMKKVIDEVPAAAIVTVVTLLIPIQMASQNWDDHDRSDRYTMRDFAKNYLDACEPNAILFTMGDNDTFPLWYMQEVEGYRTDVRVCNLSYLQTDWYVDQMRRQAYDSEPVPINWERSRYSGEKGQAAHVLSRSDLERMTKRDLEEEGGEEAKKWFAHINYNRYFDVSAFKNEMPLDEALNILENKDLYMPRNRYATKGVVIPAQRLTMDVNTGNIDWEKFNTKPDSVFTIDLGDGKGAVYRQEIMIMEMLKNINADDWKRPIYYAVTIGESPMNLSRNAMLEGIVYRIYPGKKDPTGVNVDAMFDNMVNKYQWGGVNNPKVYLDENNLRMCRSFRYMFGNLVSALMQKGDKERALLALDRCIEVLPGNTVPRGAESIIYANSYFDLGEKEKGQKVTDEVLVRADRTLDWFSRFDQEEMMYSSTDIREFMDIKIRVLDMYQRHKHEKYDELYDELLTQTDHFLKNRVMFDEDEHPINMLLMIGRRDYDISADNIEEAEIPEKLAKLSAVIQKYFKTN